MDTCESLRAPSRSLRKTRNSMGTLRSLQRVKFKKNDDILKDSNSYCKYKEPSKSILKKSGRPKSKFRLNQHGSKARIYSLPKQQKKEESSSEESEQQEEALSPEKERRLGNIRSQRSTANLIPSGNMSPQTRNIIAKLFQKDFSKCSKFEERKGSCKSDLFNKCEGRLSKVRKIKDCFSGYQNSRNLMRPRKSVPVQDLPLRTSLKRDKFDPQKIIAGYKKKIKKIPIKLEKSSSLNQLLQNKGTVKKRSRRICAPQNINKLVQRQQQARGNTTRYLFQ
ncbi:unnamed protein product [Moneuplotes crassus]|uniref:Uncharacterized protein n=1 Tax=Euplotes crassus TaxID=5936 RepID=A0AAD1UAT7_EUPCR|nr:unnamed protein product [Moneuplotes crassus]